MKIVIFIVACSMNYLHCQQIPSYDLSFDNIHLCHHQILPTIKHYTKQYANTSYPKIMAQCQYILDEKNGQRN